MAKSQRDTSDTGECSTFGRSVQAQTTHKTGKV